MRGGIDVERIIALARNAVSSAPLLFLLARTPQPDNGHHILAHPLRRAMLAAVTAHPGMTMSEVLRHVGLGWGNGYHHIEKLERARLIKKERLGRRVILYPVAPAMDPTEARARAYLKAETAKLVLADIVANPGTDAASIGARTLLSMRSVYYHLEQLTALKMIESKSASRQMALHALPLAVKIMARDE